ncbi:MAG: S46 family peptidase, partial [Bacteroidota bacterium]
MKKSISIFILSLFTIVVRADDGMWLPFLLDQSQMHDMQAAGCRMTAEDIYSVNHTSMKDAVLLFGGGCTGEMISGEGLLLTNHHCGFGYVQEHSDINHDYVKNGFWAMNKKEEYQCAGLSVTFIVSMEDVTEKMLRGIGNITDDAKKNLVIDSMSHAISIQAIAGTKYGASVRPIYYGNQFILIVSQTFNDVRLVGAPPENVGNFGGDDENWMWPRHTGDFSLFRIYADKNNEPAVYSADNIPYQPKYFFPISIKGINEGDFAMVYGFPGRTTEYISSYAVDFTQKITDPDRVKIRTIKLNLWMDAMQQSDTVNLHYATKYSGIANGWKKWQGEMDGLQRFKVVDMKKKSEDSLIQIIHFDKSLSVYSNVLSELKTAYDTLDEYQHIADYYNEALKGSEVISFAEKWLDVIDES